MIENIKDINADDYKHYFRNYAESVLVKDKHNRFCCPMCDSGNHGNSDSDSGFKIYQDDGYCFACQKSIDIYGLVGIKEGLQDFKDQLEYVVNRYGFNISITNNTKENNTSKQQQNNKQYNNIDMLVNAACSSEYLKNRSLTDETITRYKLGVDKEFIYIPYDNNYSYVVKRSIMDKKYYKPKGTTQLYNIQAIKQDKPLFICEGELDALSIMQASNYKYNAIGLGGVNGIDKLIKIIGEVKPKCKLILALDNDAAGRETTEKAITKYNKFIVSSWSSTKKDPNEMLKDNIDIFKNDIESNVKKDIDSKINRFKSINLFKSYKQRQIKDVNKIFSTGLDSVDKLLDGGLQTNLYILGACSSLGKTTLALNIANNLAEQGYKVMYYSLEMSADDIISKSISRLSYNTDDDGNKQSGVNQLKVLNNKLDFTELELVQECEKHFTENIASNLFICEGIGDIGVEEIREDIKDFVQDIQEKPIIFVDYLQILKSYDFKSSDKQNTDKAVLELKKISRDFNIPVIAISSFNRDSYSSYVTMSSFKESGAIEYGSDVLLALQPQELKQGNDK